MVLPHGLLLSTMMIIFTASVLAKDSSVDPKTAQRRPHQLRRLRSRRSHQTTKNLDYRRERVVIRIDDEQKRTTETNDEVVPDWLGAELNELQFEERILQFSSSLQFSSRLDASVNDLWAHDSLQNPTNPPSLSPSPFFVSASPSNNPSAHAPSISLSTIPRDLPSISPSGVPSDLPSLSPSWIPSDLPSLSPSWIPSDLPSISPSWIPSDLPSLSPSWVPSDLTSLSPSSGPSALPFFQ